MTTQMTEEQEEQNGKALTIRDYLYKNMTALKRSLKGQTMNPERLLSFAMNSITKNPKLLACSQLSIARSVFAAAQLGLVPDSSLNEAHLVPFHSNKSKSYECQMIIGYRGLIKLLIQTGHIIDVDPYEVYQNDQFNFNYGLKPELFHVPAEEDRGELRAVYCVIRLRDGSTKFRVMSRHDCEEHRDRFTKSKKKNGEIYGTWTDHFEAMCLKTVIRYAAKYLPLSVDMVGVQQAIQQDEIRETGHIEGNIIDLESHQTDGNGDGIVDGNSGSEPKGNGNGGGVSGLEDQLDGGNEETAPPADSPEEPPPSDFYIALDEYFIKVSGPKMKSQSECLKDIAHDVFGKKRADEITLLKELSPNEMLDLYDHLRKAGQI